VRLLGAFALLYELHWSPLAACAGRACLRLWVLTRRLGYRLVGSKHARDWDEVWKRRSEFLRGPRATASPQR
jgi:hypothetical protein